MNTKYSFEKSIDKRLAIKKLKIAEKRYRNLIEESNFGLYILENSRFVLINKNFERITGYTLKDLNASGFNFEKLIAPEDRQAVKDKTNRIIKTKKMPVIYNFKCVTKSGNKKDLRVRVSKYCYGKAHYIQGIIEDVSEEKKLELQFLQSQKMEALGKLAGGVAHEFNNLLTGILGYAELLDTIYTDGKMKSAVEVILKSSRKAAKLTGQLLNFSRRGEFNPEPLNLNDSIKDVLMLVGKFINKDIDIIENLDKNLNLIEADSCQIEQAIINILLNSIDAIPKGGKIFISSVNTYLNEKFCKIIGTLEPGNYVKISITDTGIGMTEETKQKAFEPFFSTKEKGEGTGLGLSTVYGIVKKHRGHINIFSEINQGTTVNLYFKQSESEKRLAESNQTELFFGKGSVLVIDDEKSVRSICQDMLNILGFNVYSASSGEEGITIMQKYSNEIKIVILDMIMPDMCGERTFYKIKEINPDAKVLIASGYSQNPKVENILKHGAKLFLQKPFQLKELSDAIKTTLQKPGMFH